MKIEDAKNLPDHRTLFEHHLYLVNELNRLGRLRLRKGMENPGIDKVRSLPNGRIDLHTINEGARIMMNICANMEEMDDIETNEK